MMQTKVVSLSRTRNYFSIKNLNKHLFSLFFEQFPDFLIGLCQLILA